MFVFLFSLQNCLKNICFFNFSRYLKAVLLYFNINFIIFNVLFGFYFYNRNTVTFLIDLNF